MRGVINVKPMVPLAIAGKARGMASLPSYASAPTRRCIASYKSARQCFEDVMVGVACAGFEIVTSNGRTREAEWRACAPLAGCSCRFRVHVIHNKGVTFITHSVDPRYWFYTLCRNHDLRTKQATFEAAIRRSLTT